MITSRSFLPALTVLSLVLGGCIDPQKGDDGEGGSPATTGTTSTSAQATGTGASTGEGASGGATGQGGEAGNGGSQGGSGGAGGAGGSPTGGAGGEGGSPTGGAGGSGGAGGGATAETVDPNATPETQALFLNMRNLAPKSTLIGMQNATVSGDFMNVDGKANWGLADGVKSDIRDVAGKGPAVYGFDVAALVGDYWLNDANKDTLAKNARAQYAGHMKKVYSRGGVPTLSWHQANPITNVDPKHGPHELWQIAPPEACKDILAADATVKNCGAKFDVFKAKVDILAGFLEGLKDDSGTPIPVIFRPFHENSGGWFWWGCDDKPTAKYHASLRAVWSWMVHYMADTKNIHQLLWAISPNGKGQFGTRTADEYKAFSPGMDLVDILGYDYYDKDLKFALPELRTLVDIANENGKIAAMTEGGTPNGVFDGWSSDEWSKLMVGPVINDPKAKGIAYMLFWFNTPNGQHWGPYAAHKSAADFKSVAERDDVLLEGDADLYTTP